MNEIFGYCSWNFDGALNNKFHQGEDVRIDSWYLLKRI